MKYLKDTYWEQFVDENNRFNGQKFEDFIQQILPIISKGNWIQTLKTRDGAKDFYKEEENLISWAECKLHRQNLPLTQIASTLVMAINETIGEIYIISYSKLTENNYLQLSIFQQKTSKKVYVYDDDKLEQIILNNKKLVQTYFPSFNYEEDLLYSFSEKKLDIRGIVSQDPDLEYETRFEEFTNIKEVNINQTFCMDYLIKNNNPLENIDINFTFKNSDEFLRYLKLINNGELLYNKNIDKSGVLFERLYFKPIKPLENAKLPILSINENEINLGTITIRKSFDIELVGEEVVNFRNNAKSLISGRQKTLIFKIYGESGTGKSRLILELKDIFYSENFKVISFDTENNINNSFDNIIKKSLINIFGLPNITNEHIDFYQLDNIQNNIPSIVKQILYDKDFDIYYNFEQCLELFKHIFTTRRIALNIDNFQNVDDRTAIFFKRLYTELLDIASNSILLFCFNTDFLIKESEVNKLFTEMSSYSHKQFKSFKVKPFSKDDIEIFLNEIFAEHYLNVQNDKTPTVEHPIILDLFYEKVEHKPLNIEQTIYYLLDFGNDILDNKNGIYIKDINKFQYAFESIPKGLHDLLKIRWRRILQIMTSKALQTEIDEVMYFLTLLVNVSQPLFFKFTNNNTILNELVERGILKFSNDYKITFYHNQLFLFFKDIYSIKEYQIATKIYNVIDISYKEYIYQYYIVSTIINKVDKKLVEEIFKEYIYNKPFNPYEIDVSELLFSQNEILLKNLIPKQELELYKAIGHTFKYKVSYTHSIQKLSNKFETIKKNLTRYTPYGFQFLSYIHEYANSCFSMHHDNEARNALEYAINNINFFKFSSDKEKQLILSQILNRQCVAYKSLNKIDEAISFGNKSLKIAEENDFYIMKIRNYIDIGNAISKDDSKRDLLVEYWNKAYNIFEIYHKNNDEIKNSYTMVALYKGQTLLIEGENQKALDLVNDAIEIALRNKDYFFGVKLLILKSIITITVNKDNLNESLNEIIKPLHTAQDLCIRHHGNRSYWMVFYMFAKISLIQNNATTATMNYNMALEQLISISTNQGVEEFYQDFFYDVVINTNKFHLKINKKLISNIQSQKIKKLFNKFDNNMHLNSIFTFKYGNLPNP